VSAINYGTRTRLGILLPSSNRAAAPRQRLSAAGIEPISGTPEELAVFIRSETTKWGKVIKDIGLKIE